MLNESFDGMMRTLAQNRQLCMALREIRATRGHVCEQYDICRHVACEDSHAAWEISDQALREVMSHAQLVVSVWRFEDAPGWLAHQTGPEGDEDQLILVPAQLIPDRHAWSWVERLGLRRRHELPDGSLVFVT